MVDLILSLIRDERINAEMLDVRNVGLKIMKHLINIGFMTIDDVKDHNNTVIEWLKL